MNGRIKIFLKLSTEKVIASRAIIVAVFVGIILNIINQSEYIFSLDFDKINYNKVLLTFSVPYLVSTFSSVLMKISLISGDLANISGKARCVNCNNNQIEWIKGDWISPCQNCGSSTQWKLITLLPNNNELKVKQNTKNHSFR